MTRDKTFFPALGHARAALRTGVRIREQARRLELVLCGDFRRKLDETGPVPS